MKESEIVDQVHEFCASLTSPQLKSLSEILAPTQKIILYELVEKMAQREDARFPWSEIKKLAYVMYYGFLRGTLDRVGTLIPEERDRLEKRLASEKGPSDVPADRPVKPMRRTKIAKKKS